MDFHWNGDLLTEEIPVSAGGTPDAENSIRWIYAPGSFTPIARYEKGQLYYAVTDTVGRVQELLTEDGTIMWCGKQQLWGREEGIKRMRPPVGYVFRGNMRMWNRGCTITGSGTMIVIRGSISHRIRL